MARYNYSSLLKTANRLIDRFGRDATLIKPGEPGDDPWSAASEPSESDIILVEIGYSMTNRDASLIEAGDKMTLVSSQGLAPELPDKIRLDGEDYQVIDAQPLNPGGTKLLTEVQIRR